MAWFSGIFLNYLETRIMLGGTCCGMGGMDSVAKDAFAKETF
jgi:hypothetical protein